MKTPNADANHRLETGSKRTRVSRTRSLKTALASAVVFLGAFAGLAVVGVNQAGASTLNGTANIVNADGFGPITSAGSETEFTINLPASAACDGDTATDGYHVFSYLVPVGTSPTSENFSNGFPSEDYGLVDANGNYYGKANTAQTSGQIVSIPTDLEFAPLLNRGVTAATLEANGGAWNAGIACANSSGTVTDYWNIEVTFSASGSDPNGFTWTDFEFTSNTSTTFSENNAGTFTNTATGDGTTTYAVTSGSLPSGVTLASNGTLSGTPAYGTAGTYPITITATDSNSATTTQSFTLTVSESPPVFTSASSTSFSENTAGSFPVTANGDATITYAVTTGSLPSGVTLASNGTLSGTPAFGTAGSYPVTIKATDGHSKTTTQSFTLTVASSPPVFTSASSDSFREDNADSFSVTAEGDGTITFAVTQGSLPSGVTLASNGTLSGTPAFDSSGTYPITITATDGNDATTNQSFTLTVSASAPVITSADSTTFSENNAGTFTVTADGDDPITFAVTQGSLPSDVTLASNGTLSGTPAFGAAGSYPVTITATDTNGATTTQSFTLTVSASPPVITSANSTTFIAGSADSFTVTANGDTPITFSVTHGSLPPGVSLASNGTLSGTPASSADGTYPITITATDTHGATATQSFTLTVESAPSFTSAATVTLVKKVSGSFTVTATGSPKPTLSESGALDGLTFKASTGVLSGKPTATGTFALTFTATNGISPAATQHFSLKVVALEITTKSLPGGTEGKSYSKDTLKAAGGATPYKWTATGLPTGLTLSSAGVLSGTVSKSAKAKTYTVTITVTDSSKPKLTATAKLSLVVAK